MYLYKFKIFDDVSLVFKMQMILVKNEHTLCITIVYLEPGEKERGKC